MWRPAQVCQCLLSILAKNQCLNTTDTTKTTGIDSARQARPLAEPSSVALRPSG